jgi:hypothetical protein
VDQFFEFQGTIEAQKVSLASFHLQGEANQWWKWLRRSFREEDREVTGAFFKKSCGQDLALPNVRTSMRPYTRSNRRDLCASIKFVSDDFDQLHIIDSMFFERTGRFVFEYPLHLFLDQSSNGSQILERIVKEEMSFAK